MLAKNIDLWRVRLDTEQAQIDAMARAIETLKKQWCNEPSLKRAAQLVEKIDALKRNHVIMVNMREALRDRLGACGLLAAIEGR